MRGQSSELESVKEFRETFIDEFLSFESNARGLSQGHGTFANSKKDWFTVGSLSAGVVLINATFGILAGVGVMAGVVSSGIAVGVSLLGVLGGIAYNRYKNARNRRMYKETVDMMDKENIKNDIDIITACLIDQKADYLATCTPVQAISLAKKTSKELATFLTKGEMNTKAQVVRWASKGKPDSDGLYGHSKQFQASTISMMDRLREPKPDNERTANLAFASGYSHSPAVERWKQRRQPSVFQKVKNFFGKLFSIFGSSRKSTSLDVELKPATNRQMFH